MPRRIAGRLKHLREVELVPVAESELNVCPGSSFVLGISSLWQVGAPVVRPVNPNHGLRVRNRQETDVFIDKVLPIGSQQVRDTETGTVEDRSLTSLEHGHRRTEINRFSVFWEATGILHVHNRLDPRHIVGIRKLCLVAHQRIRETRVRCEIIGLHRLKGDPSHKGRPLTKSNRSYSLCRCCSTERHHLLKICRQVKP